MESKMIRGMLTGLLMLAAGVSLFTGFTADAQEAQVMEEETSAAGLRNPVVKEDSSMEAGQKVTWDCVWFGSYPQAEVVISEEEYGGVIKSALSEGDIIADSTLFGALEKASGWDEKNEIMLGGQRYRRMKKEDATAAFTGGGENYYRWSDTDDSYHYFKYEPVKWRVLKAEGGQALLLSDIALDAQKCDDPSLMYFTWETSTIRSWLNGYGSSSNQNGIDYTNKNFIGSAFSSSQESAIADTDVVNADHLQPGKEGGDDTRDKVFLLSASEAYGDSAAAYGFIVGKGHDEARGCKSSTYAKAMVAHIRTEETVNGRCWWWLRTPGASEKAACVYAEGSITSESAQVGAGVRAALTLNLSSDQYSYAGTVCSDGTEEEKAYSGSGSDNEGYLSLQDASVTLANGKRYYTGEQQCPQVTVRYEGEKLEEGQDYTVSYENNIQPSFDPYCPECYGHSEYDTKSIEENYAKAVISGIGLYTGTATKYFRIRGFADMSATSGFQDRYDYTGEEIRPKPEIVLYDGNNITGSLAEDTDYRLSYSDNTEPGRATILVTGIRKYEGYGSWHIHFTIRSKDISDYEVLLSADGEKYEEALPENTYTADGKEKTPYVHITPVIQKDGSYEPADPSRYDVAYENNVSAGTATVRITARPPYTGTLTRTFVIGQGESELDRFTYGFGNTREDFGYPQDYVIDEKSIFTRLWGSTMRAQGYYDEWTKNFGKWSGNCYGMSATSVMFNDDRDDIEVSGFNSKASRVRELALTDYNRNSNIRMSLLDFIESMQVSQVDDTVSYIIRRANKGQLGRMCQELEKAQKNDTAVIIVLDSSGPSALHSVVGYGIEDVSDTQRRIHVYDCNHPGEQKSITLTMEDGACTGWYYDGSTEKQRLVWTSEKKDGVSCTISYISYDSFIKVWLNRSLDNVASEKNVMTLNTSNAVICDKGGEELAVLKDGEILSENDEIYEFYPICAAGDGTGDKSEIQPLIYLPRDEYIVKNTDKDVGEMELSMFNVNQMVTVSTSAPGVAVCVDDSSNTNVIRMASADGEKETVKAAFHSSDGQGKYKTVSYIGNTVSSSMSLGVADGNTVEEGFHVADKEVVEKDDGSPEDEPQKEQTEGNLPKTEDASFKIASDTGSNKIAAGKKIKLKVVSASPAGAEGLSFKSSNPKAVSVDGNGTVAAKKKAGGKSAVITATNGRGYTASIRFRVMKGAVKKVKVTGKKSCKAGKNLKLKAKVSAGKGANKTVIWKSSDPRYAEVSKKGVVKTKKDGKGKSVKITAVATDGSKKSGSIKIKIK